MVTRPRSTRSDEDYLSILENNLNWQIFADISLGAARGLWRYVEVGRAISATELPHILAGTLPPDHSPISGSLIRWSIPFMFLAGLGVECLLKAIRILQFRAAATPAATVKKGRLVLAKELKTHNLTELARAAGISLTPDELNLLQRLTDFVEWAGRYPVGVAASSTATDAGIYYADDHDRVCSLVDRLKAKCDELDPNRELYERRRREIQGDDRC